MNKEILQKIIKKIKKQSIKYDSDFEEHLEEHQDLIQIEFEDMTSYPLHKDGIQLVIFDYFLSKKLLTYIMRQLEIYDYRLEFDNDRRRVIFNFERKKVM